jgi:vacuolar-type H+-ATPase catalytic subunit A/Vma1
VSKVSEIAYEAELVSSAVRASQRIAELESALRRVINEVIPDSMRDMNQIVRDAEDILEKEW